MRDKAISRITDRTTLMSGDLMKNESGTAYGLVILAALLVVGTLFIAILAPLINGMIDVYNYQIGDGYVSEQRGDAMDFLLVLWRGIPVWVFFAFCAWGIVRALEQRSSGVG